MSTDFTTILSTSQVFLSTFIPVGMHFLPGDIDHGETTEWALVTVQVGVLPGARIHGDGIIPGGTIALDMVMATAIPT